MSEITHYRRGRPSKYRPLLERIRDFYGEPGWHIIDRNQATHHAPSSMRKRYEGWDFRCEKNDHGKYDLLARWVGE